MKKIVVSGKTIEDAVRNGLEQWQVSEDRVEVNVLEQPAKGLFGLIGARDAKVELTLRPDAAEEAEAFVANVARAMGLDVRIERRESPDGLLFALTGGEDLGMLIGRRGQTLDALQYLVNIVANRYADHHLRIVLDAEDFRERRRKTLEQLSERLAGRVVRTRKDVELEPMSAHERKVIHSQLQHHPKVKTYSKGDEPNRRVVITMKV
ncbi:DNA-binding protein [Paenibacillus sp. 32O-W]|jgi:spoIIIJ-associated protein|uniref:RNA-binding protein KhpB n=1 Tax=Paenibacillus cisolokensis TaxID=1658519 RepID=A0ABQ4N793_9BACL|nr:MULTISPECIES: RNA-binding cell elongation regulator Jag/EloR [Paenibacillus]ALS25791.1 DNA-binding protein [Paenibacillus sp. 32O-W]GIQ64040.1 DNA-binding protein [Paenibacillus cisolokensis]